MNDNLAWQQALAAADEIFGRLAPGQMSDLEKLFQRIARLKEELLKAPLAAGSHAVCHACNGACCLYGKYHLTMVDLLAFRFSGTETVSPEFGAAPGCPYGTPAGCTMPPRLRPMTCVIFNCEAVEGLLPESQLEVDRLTERELRHAVAEIADIVGSPVGRPALLFVNPGPDDGSGNRKHLQNIGKE